MASRITVNTKSMTDQQNERVAKVTQYLMDVKFESNQSYIARELGVSQAYINQIVRSARGAGSRIILKLADYLNCSVDEILDESISIDELVRPQHHNPSIRRATRFAIEEGIPSRIVQQAIRKAKYVGDVSGFELVAAIQREFMESKKSR